MLVLTRELELTRAQAAGVQVYNALNHNEIEPCACLQTAQLLNAEVQHNRTLVIHAGDLVSLSSMPAVMCAWLALLARCSIDALAMCAGLLVVSAHADELSARAVFHKGTFIAYRLPDSLMLGFLHLRCLTSGVLLSGNAYGVDVLAPLLRLLFVSAVLSGGPDSCLLQVYGHAGAHAGSSALHDSTGVPCQDA